MTPYQEQQLTDCNAVVQLKDSYGWKVIQRDAQSNFDAISTSWFDLEEGSIEVKEARARQIANNTILNLMRLYEEKFQEISLEIIQKEDEGSIQTTDVDNGAVEDTKDE